jgi:hypothetical protein
MGDRRPRQQLGTANGVAGGRQTIYTAGLNWDVNGNIRFMFDYLHGNIAKQLSPTDAAETRAPSLTRSRCVRRSPSEQLVSEDEAASVAAAPLIALKDQIRHGNGVKLANCRRYVRRPLSSQAPAEIVGETS